MVRIEDLPDEKQKPLLPQATGVDALLAPKDDSQTLLDIIRVTANHLADSLQAVVHQTVPADVECEIRVEPKSCARETGKQGIPRPVVHLPPRIIL